jgi:hypothetical protein
MLVPFCWGVGVRRRGTFAISASWHGMSDTDQRAKSGMIRFVIAIFVIGMVFAGAYLMFWTPGEMNSAPAGEVISD